ncbi:hypothetical protein pb186bvf_014518 [Paramecium bursaria]
MNVQFSQRALKWIEKLGVKLEQVNIYFSFVDEFKQNEQEKQIYIEIQTLNDVEDHEEYLHKKNNIICKYMDVDKYLEDETVFDQIQKDIQRTQNEEPFFFEELKEKIIPKFQLQWLKERKSSNHKDILARILYIYARLNPAIGYTQGMNEIVANLYYVINDEATTFFCFTSFMSQIKDLYIRSLNNTKDGLKGQMLRLDQLLNQLEPNLQKHFTKLEIHPQFYSMRWIKLALSHEFTLDQIVQIWDELIDQREIQQKILGLCIALLKYLKPKLIQADFVQCMKLLQNSEKDVDQILKIYQEIQKKQMIY